MADQDVVSRVVNCKHGQLQYDLTIAAYDKPRRSAKDPRRTWVVAEIRFRCVGCLQPFTVKNIQPGIVGDVPVRHPDGLVVLPLELHEEQESKSPIIIPRGALCPKPN